MANKVEIAPLTGLRFAAAFAILFQHTVSWCTPFSNSHVSNVAAGFVGSYGMTLFFVLSGFVIHYNYARTFHKQPYSLALRDFFAARFARIYPLFLFFCVFGAVSDFTANWIHYAPRTFLSYIIHSITLTQSWVYKIVVNHRVLLDNGFGLGWSISTEFFFYIVYAILAFAILRIRRPATSFAAVTIFAMTSFCILGLAYAYTDEILETARAHVTYYIDPKSDWSNSFYRWLFYYSPYSRIWEFLLGCLTAQLFINLRERPVSHRERICSTIILWLALASILALAVIHAAPLPGTAVVALVRYLELNFGFAVPVAAVIFCTARYRSSIASFLSLPWIVWLGNISYSIYAVHTWTVRPFIRPAVEFNEIYAMDAILRVSLAIAFTVIVATATYAIIEVPCRRYLRTKFTGRPGVPEGTDAQDRSVKAGAEKKPETETKLAAV